ncbi:hypothetical protein BJV82DRAFT_377553 [Fennellomyces sp. T-0311]|nr:hypothetical protein BJV82DRAFT_377553 [Fennellomyces sp. T-0311]
MTFIGWTKTPVHLWRAITDAMLIQGAFTNLPFRLDRRFGFVIPKLPSQVERHPLHLYQNHPIRTVSGHWSYGLVFCLTWFVAKWTPTAAFESDDMEPRNVMDHRTSLTVEVARMWKRKPTVTKSEEVRRRVNKEDEGINGLLGQLLVSQALVDAELYNTLSFEQLSELKQ